MKSRTFTRKEIQTLKSVGEGIAEFLAITFVIIAIIGFFATLEVLIMEGL